MSMNARVREIKMKCPLCKIGEITIVHIPSSVRFKKGTWGGSRPGVIRSSEQNDIQEEKCPYCGKTKKDIQKEFDGEREIDHKEALERLKKRGLPTRIES
jgi:phage FluMu protein Com